MTDKGTGAKGDRPLGLALKRGLRGLCPACGGARLFRRFLKPVEACPACGECWAERRADDFPAYLAILVTGHLLLPVIVEVNIQFDVGTLTQMIGWPLVAAGMALAMIQPLKGAVLGLLWAR
ncbi:MAG: DUF983 domain-containing protein [Sphingomonas sp.]|nr:DUF983 domain-containing protein [Sphingomonas sp.]MDX3883411.1 DUF983 domain-containing protein [Sphingomonas sp.]